MNSPLATWHSRLSETCGHNKRIEGDSRNIEIILGIIKSLEYYKSWLRLFLNSQSFYQFVCCGFLLVRLGHTRATCHSPRGLSLLSDARIRLDVSSIFSHTGRTARTNENLWAALTVGFQCVREHSQWMNGRRLRGIKGNKFPQLAEIHLLLESRTCRFRHNSNTHATQTHTQYGKDSQGGWATQARF